MTVHYVKSWSYLYAAAVAGVKTHDIRDRTERDYKVGDTLVLQEFDQSTGRYSGREQRFEITYITDRDVPCALSSAVLARDYCILSITLLGEG